MSSAGYAETRLSVHRANPTAEFGKICPIFRVPSILRNCAPDMFRPQVVVIGPLHDPELFIEENLPSLLDTYCEMDRYKCLAFASIFGGDPSAEGRFLDILQGIFDSIISDYNINDISEDYAKNSFLKRIAMDACFIAAILNSLLMESLPVLEHYIQISHDHSLEERFKHPSKWNVPMHVAKHCKSAGSFHDIFVNRVSRPERKAIIQDLMLVENQIPFQALRLAIHFDSGLEEKGAIENLLQLYIATLAHRILPIAKSKLSVFKNVQNATMEGHHLLDIVYSIVCAHTSNPEPTQDVKHLDVHMVDMPGARTLRLSGVDVTGHWEGLTKIEFKNGKLSLPRIHVGDDTESYFRNLIAYESRCKPDKMDVISYLHFMDFLIDTHADVEILFERRIITQTVGSNEKVAEMWNSLCRNTMCAFSPTYRRVAEDLKKYCKSPYRKLWAEFYSSKLSRPWMVVSILSAAALLIMTFLILWYDNDKKSMACSGRFAGWVTWRWRRRFSCALKIIWFYAPPRWMFKPHFPSDISWLTL